MSEWTEVNRDDKATLPAKGQDVIAFFNVGGRSTIEIAQHMGDAIWQIDSVGDPFQDCITHWMPLPAVPRKHRRKAA